MSVASLDPFHATPGHGRRRALVIAELRQFTSTSSRTRYRGDTIPGTTPHLGTSAGEMSDEETKKCRPVA